MMKLLLIVVIQLVYVPLLTLRTITMVKNLKILTAVFGFLEAFVYVFGLAIVISGDQNVLEMIVYAVGFALGLFFGIYVEQKMAIGYISVFANINHKNEELVKHLREKGYGVTIYQGEGLHSARYRLEILTKRRREKDLYKIIKEFEEKAFIVSFEPKTFKGGYLSEIMKKRLKRNPIMVHDDNNSANGIADGFKEIKRETIELIRTWRF